MSENPMFTKQELSVIGQLILKAEIKGVDAFPVAQLLQKIEGLLKEPIKKVEAPKGEEKK